MIEQRRIEDIGGTEQDWLSAKHHFALGPYGNTAHKPLGNLYVWNDDKIAPHTGFSPHNHANVEIVTYVREGVVTHTDNLGNVGHIAAGDVQVMSAGTGIRHSERNDGDTPARLFQIWLAPSEVGGAPNWGTRPFPKNDRAGRFVLLASKSGRDGSLSIRADADLLGALLPARTSVAYEIQEGEQAYIVPSTGLITVNGERLRARDGGAIYGEHLLRIDALEDSEIIMVVAGKRGANQ